jgi:hypothetical protein
MEDLKSLNSKILNEASLEELEERLELSCWIDGCNNKYLDDLCDYNHYNRPPGTEIQDEEIQDEEIQDEEI